VEKQRTKQQKRERGVKRREDGLRISNFIHLTSIVSALNSNSSLRQDLTNGTAGAPVIFHPFILSVYILLFIYHLFTAVYFLLFILLFIYSCLFYCLFTPVCFIVYLLLFVLLFIYSCLFYCLFTPVCFPFIYWCFRYFNNDDSLMFNRVTYWLHKYVFNSSFVCR